MELHWSIGMVLTLTWYDLYYLCGMNEFLLYYPFRTLRNYIRHYAWFMFGFSLGHKDGITLYYSSGDTQDLNLGYDDGPEF